MDQMPTATDVAELFRAINNMKTEGLLFLLVIILIVVAFLLVRHYLRIKKERESALLKEEHDREIDKEKHKRAQMYTNALSAITKSFTDHTKKEEHILERLDITMGRVSDSLGRVDTCLTSFLLNQTSSMNLTDSKRIVKEKFIGQINHSIAYLIEKSLRENDFINRREFVVANIKTAMGHILIQARSELNDYKLAIHSDDYFKIVPGVQVERFVLCDILWDMVEGFYRSHTNLDQRLQEMRLVVSNTITDHVAGLEKHVKEKSPSTLLMAISPLANQNIHS